MSTLTPGSAPSPLSKALMGLREAREKLEAIERAKCEPVAIVGLGCRFPGELNDPQTFWRFLQAGRDAIREVPGDRWDVGRYFDARPGTAGRMYTRWGGFLSDPGLFDAGFFGITPREARVMDPQQRVLLEVTWEALEDANILPEALSGQPAGVFMGICSSDYAHRTLADAMTVDAFAGAGAALSIAANRLSYFLNLKGPSLAVDTACSSSLVALHLAAQSLRRRESHVALVGAVNLVLKPEVTVSFCAAQMLAADGRCKTFDANADGYVRGEGAGVLVLKRLSDALADGNAIYALVLGSAVNQDGRSNGLTAPNVLSQEALLKQALYEASVEAEEVGYIEAHGTGTSLGDPVELDALQRVFGGRPRPDGYPCFLGSVKTNIGHLEAAAGIAGVAKTALCLRHGAVVPHLNFRTLNPSISLEGTPFVISTEPRPWTGREGRRVATVSAFGFGGTNACVVLASPPAVSPASPKANPHPAQLLCLSARSPEALGQLAAQHASALEEPEADLAEHCATTNMARTAFPARATAVAATRESMLEQLHVLVNASAAESMSRSEDASALSVVFIYSSACETSATARELNARFEPFRAAIAQCEELLRDDFQGTSLIAILAADKAERSRLGELADAALFASLWALGQLWEAWGIKPAAVAGEGVGELVAACRAGQLTLEQGLRLARTGSRVAKVPGGGTPSLQLPLLSGVRDELARAGYDTLLDLGEDSASWPRLLNRLGTLWKVGAKPCWSAFYAQTGVRRTRVPTYPFQRQRYWFEGASHPVALEPRAPSNFLGERLRSPSLKDLVFQRQVDRNTLPLLDDHLVRGSRVVPAAVFVSMVVTAGEALHPGAGVVLEDVVFEVALSLDDETSRTLQLLLRPSSAGSYRFEILSTQGDDAWVCHVVGHLRCGSEPAAKPAQAARWSKGFPFEGATALDVAEWLEVSRRRGLTFGPRFQTIARCWYREGVAAAELRTEERFAGECAHAALDPLLLDGCFQAAGLAALGLGPEGLWVPWRIDRLEVSSRKGRVAKCHAQRQASTASVLDCLLDIVDERGEQLARVEGFQFRKVGISDGKTLERALYTRAWKPNAPRTTSPAPAERWLVFADREGVANALRRELVGSAKAVFVNRGEAFRWQSDGEVVIRPTEREDLVRLFHEASPSFDRILYMWSLDVPQGWADDARSLEGTQQQLLEPVVLLAQTLTALRSSPRSFILATRGAQRVIASDNLSSGLPASALWGLGASLRLEQPELGCRNVDVDPEDGSEAARRALLSEWAESEESEVAYRGGQRWAARLLPRDPATAPQAEVRADATYLVTGAHGELGQLFTDQLIALGARSLVLVGRSAPSQPRSFPADVKAIQVEADVADQVSVARLFDEVLAKLPTLRGVIHAAGVTDDGSLVDLGWERFSRVLAPKVQGSWNLHLKTQALPLDFFLVFSSLTSVLGGFGQANYASANAFADALAQLRHAKGMVGTAVNWAPWDIGMAARVDPRTKSSWRDRGIHPIRADEGAALFSQLVSLAEPQLAVVPIDWQKFAASGAQARRSVLAEVLGGSRSRLSAPSHEPTEGLVQRLERAPRRKRKELAEAFVVDLLAEAIGVPPEKIIPTASVFDLGVDSLLAIELRNRLGRELGRVLASTVLFDYSTCEAIAGLLLSELESTGEDLSQPGVSRPLSDVETDFDLSAILEDVSAQSDDAITQQILDKKV